VLQEAEKPKSWLESRRYIEELREDHLKVAATVEIRLYNGVVNFVLTRAVRILLGIGVLAWVGTACGWAQEKPEAGQGVPAAAPNAKSGGSKQPAAAAAAALEQQDLQKAIEQASNDRAALMHNLLDFPLRSIRNLRIGGRFYRAYCGNEPAASGFCDGDGVRGADGGA